MTNEVDSELAAALLAALLDDDPEAPPVELRSAMLDRAQRRRPSGSWCGTLDPISPLEAFRRASAHLGDVLAVLGDDDWTRSARGDWTVKDLVAHLVGADEYTGAVLGLWASPVPDPRPTHAEATAPAMTRLAAAAPATVAAEWRRGVADLVARRADLTARLDDVVDLYGAQLPISDVLTVRAFEVWAHSEEIAAAAGLGLDAPEPERLALMSELAVRLLPFGLQLTHEQVPPGCARLVLTGAGGGSWDVPFTPELASAAPDVVVVLDVVEFCRHAAHGHLHAERIDEVEGDRTLVPPLLTGAAAFAE
jgi:uncharacterized protein (TIGR03083 family)